MSGPSRSSRSTTAPEGGEVISRRVRHVTSIQVRNLTPFPVRDEFASALTQPSEQPQFTAHGHLSDDLDVTIGRKRGRRRSSTSVSNHALMNPAEGEPGVNGIDGFVRKRTSSRASIASSVGSTHNVKGRSTGPPVVRPSHRPRTISTTSIGSRHSLSGQDALHTSVALSGFLRDTSQVALEHILQSRLVETFLTVSILPTEDPAPVDVQVSSPGSHATSSHGSVDPNRATRRNTIVASGSDALPRTPTPSKRGSISGNNSVLRPSSSSHSKSMSVSSLPSNRTLNRPSAPKSLVHRTPASRPSNLRNAPSPSPSTSRPSTPDSTKDKTFTPPPPDYLSPIHRPSTNPLFNIVARKGYDFAPDADLSSSTMTVEVWGKITAHPHSSKDKGKGKERAHPSSVQDVEEWRVLERWDVNLNQLVPLPDDLRDHPSRLPSNTLCITLDPPGRTYYLPPSRSAFVVPSTSRSSSPTAGYNSDPETDARRTREPKALSKAELQVTWKDKQEDLTRSPISPHSAEHARKGSRRSATWQDLLKIAHLQKCIQENQESVSTIVKDMDSYITNDTVFTLTREVSERKAWLNELQDEVSSVEQQSQTLRDTLQAKRDALHQRRQILELARQAHADDLREEAENEDVLQDERDSLALLRSRLPLIRNSLFTSLAFIYPIELLSPPDLLFTILGVPLPIPNGPTDPAPPLSVPSNKEINEETIATALGYAAQVVQMLAAYLGMGLIYPVTCVGSRSLIKDGISAMVGPRMFPLFSKGVDTYRFEYAVFLLNKDIEMLMTERNLRALDMRHTLPNLKNLLLTLTDPDTVDKFTHRPASIASTTISALQSPVLKPSSTISELEAPPLQSVDSTSSMLSETTTDADTPPASGSTTPREAPEGATTHGTVRKSRAFLDLTPLSGFFRSRYPSTSRGSSKAETVADEESAGEATPTIPPANGPDVSAAPEGHAEGSGAGDDEDDRRTIRASADDDDGAESVKHRAKSASKGIANGNGSAVGHEPVAEKVGDSLPARGFVDSLS